MNSSSALVLAPTDPKSMLDTFFQTTMSDTKYSIVVALGTFSTLIWCLAMPTFCMQRRSTTKLVRPSTSVVLSFSFLITVAISKTVLTKYIFEHLKAPVAMSALSCILTTCLLLPVTIFKRQFRMLRITELATFSSV